MLCLIKMAAKVLDDIVNNFLSLDVLLGWLSNKSSTNEDKIFLDQYECSQIEFVSYFLVFLREQSSRDFQVYDAETPRKNSHSRMMKISNITAEKSSPQLNFHQEFSPVVKNLDLESQYSFPSLSSCSSKIESNEKKILETHQSDLESLNKNSCERKLRRVKLFSETVETNLKGNNSSKKEVEFLEDIDFKQVNENKFTMSTPKPTGNSLLPLTDYFNTSDPQDEYSPKLGSKLKWKNNSLDLSSPEINSSAIKSRSFSSDQSYKSKENKVKCKLSLGDFIVNDISPSDNKKDKKSKAKKRINPVKVIGQTTVNVSSPFSEKNEEFEECISGLVEEKVVLKVGAEKNVLDKDKDIMQVKIVSNSQVEKQAELESATYTTELKILSQIYSCLINENYCQNIMIELCFVISLLVIQDYNKKMTDLELGMKNLSLLREKKFFSSIHNCVYFAVETLWLQRNLLLLLNLSALKLLSENTRIEKFNMQLKDFLVSACNKKQSNEESKRHNGLLKAAMQGNVSFQYETDNRENFTSNSNFHSFRKQRDLFYNILAIWEANHLVSGWSFSVGLGSKIRNLLAISSDPINLLHLSRLFRDQLIMSCCGENQTEEDFNEDILQLLPTADPNKILRLRARLTSSPKRQGPCPLPDFSGHQEFYKDFILCTSHSVFHEHLKNSLCDEILRLNNTELTGDIEDDDSCLDDQTQERYLQCTNILRLLAKFLGFIEFLPYRGEKHVSNRILNIHCSVRHNTLPFFDVVSCLKSALKKQRLTLTIPWLVSYLSMIDHYSAHLKTYQSVWRLLILIYKQLKTYKNVKNSFYLKLTLGWMFQLPNFPPDQFYAVLDDFNKTPEDPEVLFSNEAKVGLDFYDFVEETVLYTVCPYLNELNVILSENLGCSVRHIRPVTTQENSITKLQASKQLELRLESNFLHNQSSSTRKTVEFVTERVASIVIKHLIHNVIPKIKEAAWISLENLSTNDLKEAETESETLSESCHKEILAVCEKENWEISCKRSEIALKALLSSDLQRSVVNTCTKIVTRQAIERVQRWMESHVTLAMIKTEFITLTRKRFIKATNHNNSTMEASDLCLQRPSLDKTTSFKDPYGLPPNARDLIHIEEAWPASQTIKTVRELIWKLYEEGLYSQEVEEVIEIAIKTIKNRNDLIPIAEKALFSIIVDLIVCFCALSVGDVSDGILKKFLHFLTSLGYQNSSLTSLERIICPRNVGMVLNEAKNKKKAWDNLGKFMLFLMEEDILTKEQVEAQLLSLLRQNWEKEDGFQFSKLISQILDSYSKKNGCDKFSLLLEYMIDTFNDDEPKSESLG